MKALREKIHRLERIIDVRQIAVAAAEGQVREAEAEVRALEQKLEGEEGKIRQAMEEFAQPTGADGFRMQNAERVAKAAGQRAQIVRQEIEKARGKVEERLSEWRVARQEKRTVEKLRERQLQKAVREEAALMQKVIDEASVSRHVRKPRA